MISLKVPGKLFILGEYSVLKPGNEAVLVAVDKFINVEVNAQEEYEFKSELGHFRWMLSDRLPVFSYDELTHAKAGIYIAHRYLNYKGIEPRTYRINLESELTSKENIKYGLGSSGAVIIAVIKSILDFHKVKIRKINLFKLAVLAQIEINDITSGGELAASIYGGWVHYQRYDLIWVMNRKGKFDEIIQLDWPLLSIKRLGIPDVQLAICFSGFSQSTKISTEKFQELSSGTWYPGFLNKTRLLVSQFKSAVERSDYYTMKYLIELYRGQLKELEEQSEVVIESEPFKKMIQTANNLGFASKTSGAGFGDCGFALVKNGVDKVRLQDEWIKQGLTALEIEVWNHDKE